MYDDYKVKLLHIRLSKTRAYVNIFGGQTKWMYFLFEDNNLLENIILFRVKSALIIKNEFDSKPVYSEIFLKYKRKSYGHAVIDFYDKEIPKVDSNHTCLAVISLDSALKKDRNFHLQIFLKECKCNEKKVITHINDDLSGVSYSAESDEE